MLSDKDVQTRARALAVQLADIDTDHNVLGSLEAFLRDAREPSQFWALLAALPRSGEAQRSNLTRGYYEAIAAALKPDRHRELVELRRIVSWARRLLTYLNDKSDRKRRHSAHGGLSAPRNRGVYRSPRV